jgi:hypothetical protein
LLYSPNFCIEFWFLLIKRENKIRHKSRPARTVCDHSRLQSKCQRYYTIARKNQKHINYEYLLQLNTARWRYVVWLLIIDN